MNDLKSDVRLLKWMAGTNIALTLILLGTALTVLTRLGEVTGQTTQLAQRIH